MIDLTLFFREGCHLCDVMLRELAPYIELPNVKIQRIDIDEHPQWLEAYNEFVPVLHINDEPVCKYRLDKAKLDVFLAKN